MAFNLFKKKDTKKKEPAPAVIDVPAADVSEEKKEPVAVVPMKGISVLKHMHVSEKSSLGEKINQYTFIVTPNANKSEIAKEVENRYNVTVHSVNVNKRRGKDRRIGTHSGRTAGIKKAIVTIEEGQTITGA